VSVSVGSVGQSNRNSNLRISGFKLTNAMTGRLSSCATKTSVTCVCVVYSLWGWSVYQFLFFYIQNIVF